MTEREKFIVPVQAIGARALLDFPDDVKFSAAPVKVHVCAHRMDIFCITVFFGGIVSILLPS